MIEQLAKGTTLWLLRYATITKPAFRFEYVHAYCQLAELLMGGNFDVFDAFQLDRQIV